MRKLFTALTLALCVSFAAPQAQAQITIVPNVGYNIEDGFGFLVGIGVQVDAPFEIQNLDLSLLPSAEYVFTDGDGVSYFQINGDIIATFAPNGSIAPFAGAGLAIGIISVDDIEVPGFGTVEGDSNTEIGLNLLGGVTFPGALGFGEPFVQGRLTLIEGSQISIIGGVRIPLGN